MKQNYTYSPRLTSFKEVEHKFELMAARGKIKEEHVPLLSHVMISEEVARAFYTGYYGDAVMNQAEQDVLAAKDNESKALLQSWNKKGRENITGATLDGLTKPLLRASIVTTLDIPTVLGRIGSVTVRPAEERFSTDSSIMNLAYKRTGVPAGKLQSVSREYDDLGLFPKPEGDSVRYEGFATGEDEYETAIYARAIGWTYEAKLKDELYRFLDDVAALGYAARLERLRILARAIISDIARVQYDGAAGGPTVSRLLDVRDTFFNANNRSMRGIAIARIWEGLAQSSLENDVIPGVTPVEQNQMKNAFTIGLEDVLPNEFGKATPGDVKDWLAHDGTQFVEFATVAGYDTPVVRFKAPNVLNGVELGDFDNMTDAMQIVDYAGAKVTQPESATLVAGA